ncbi:MAG: sulfotransferase [Planctomycetota bacterium]
MSLKHAILAPGRAAAMAMLSPIEATLQKRSRDGAFAPPVFVVGPPRSGTTLLYELLITRFRFAYISNLAHRLYRAPAAATMLGRGVVSRWQGRFESRYGHVAGWGAPNEGGWVWQRWIPEEHTLTEVELNGRDLDTLVRTMNSISQVMSAPFINKNVMLGVQMRLLDHLFPGCSFVEITRDPVANARSMLRARREDGGEGGEREWISVRPDGWEAFRDANPAEQVAAQVLLASAQIARDASEIERSSGKPRLCTVDYASLCARPREILDEVGSFLRSTGRELENRGDVPDRFDHRAAPEDEDTVRVRAGLEAVRRQLQTNEQLVASGDAPAVRGG